LLAGSTLRRRLADHRWWRRQGDSRVLWLALSLLYSQATQANVMGGGGMAAAAALCNFSVAFSAFFNCPLLSPSPGML